MGIRDEVRRLSAEHDRMAAYISQKHGESVLSAVLAGPHPSKRAIDMTEVEKDRRIEELCAELDR